jgi:hypothetical protein
MTDTTKAELMKLARRIALLEDDIRQMKVKTIENKVIIQRLREKQFFLLEDDKLKGDA